MNLDQLNYYIKNDTGLQNTLATWLGTSGLGNTFFVDSVNGSDTSCDGKTWENPLATVNAAVAKCTASNGDVIYVAPWHAETISTAALSPVISKAGIRVIGVGFGLQMPTFTITHVDGTFSVTAASCTVKGLLIKSNVDNVKVGMTLAAGADGCIVDGNYFRDSAADKDTLVFLSLASACTDCTIINNNFYTTVTAGGNNAILLTGGNTATVIRNNVAYGMFATGVILGSAACLGLVIENNKLVNAEAAIAIALHTSSTGILANNYLGGATSTIAAVLTGDNLMWCFENYIADAYAASGVLNPAVVAAD